MNGVWQTGQTLEPAAVVVRSGGTVGHPLPQGLGVAVVGAQPVGRPVDADDHRAVQQPVEHGGGDGGVPERRCPVGDADVGGQDRARLQVALVDDLEQRGGAVAGQRQIPKLVDDQQAGPANKRMQVAQRPSRAALWQRAARSAAVVQ